MFPLPVLPTRTDTPCNWEGISMHSLATLVCQLWGKYRWNMGIAGKNVLFWRGSIKRLELQMTYGYRTKTFIIYSYRCGQPPSVDKRSNLMRVSHSWTSNLKIPQIYKIFWPASEPCIGATNKYSDSMFPLPVLHIRTYTPCNWEGISMHSLATLVCQRWRKYRWNMEIAGENVLFWMGSIKRLKLQTTYWYRAEPSIIYSYMSGQPAFVDTRSDLLRVSHSWTSNLKILQIYKIFWPASEPCIGATITYSDSIFPVLILRTRTYLTCN